MEQQPIYAALEYIYGLGPVQAKSIYRDLLELGLAKPKVEYTESQFRKMLLDKRIYSMLPTVTKADLKYKPIKTIPRDLIHIMNGELQKYARGIKFTVAGSYRRGKPISHDIDIVLSIGSNGTPYEILDLFMERVNTKSKILKLLEPFARGNDKAGLLMHIQVPEELRSNNLVKNKKSVYFKVDIFLSKPEEYMYALLFATGSGAFNVRMRAVAKKKGYLLNQRGLFRKARDASGVEILEQVPIKNEREIFDVLGITYKTPGERVK
jgi:DNA polymerase/3'-5' exonuclease PolX